MPSSPVALSWATIENVILILPMRSGCSLLSQQFDKLYWLSIKRQTMLGHAGEGFLQSFLTCTQR